MVRERKREREREREREAMAFITLVCVVWGWSRYKAGNDLFTGVGWWVCEVGVGSDKFLWSF